MTQITFYKANDDIVGFEVFGHAMFDDEGFDIVCAAISSMTGLVINTITEVYHDIADVTVDGDSARIEFILKSSDNKASTGLLIGFMEEIRELKNQYPDNVNYKQQNITKGK